MKKNTDKLVTKQDNPLGLILFSIIYFLVQEGIYPALAYLFWFASALFSAAIFFVAPEHILKISVIVFSVISLIIILGIMYFLGYLCKGFLKKMNKAVLGSVMIAILIFFLYKIFTEPNEDTTMFAPTQRQIYIFCTASHIFYTIGVFFSDKVKKILDRIKFKRKNK